MVATTTPPDEGVLAGPVEPAPADVGVIPAGLPPAPLRRREGPRWRGVAGVAVVGTTPMLLLLVSLVVGGGPRTESADDALITMITRDAVVGVRLTGPYSRFGWHHPGPIYFYLLSLPTWLWHRAPTGSWVGGTVVGVACAAATAAGVRRWAGPRAGWWAAAGTLAVVTGLGPALLRDPWNPYVVTLPVLFAVVASAAAAAGAPGALPWALVVGTVAIQTHVSTAPVVGGLLAVAAVARAVRWRPGRHRGDIPEGLPAIGAAGRPQRWWRRRPDVALALVLLVIEWLPPGLDELFGTGNLSTLVRFFTASHPRHGWALSWRLTTSILGITMFQHHQAIRDGVADPHPVVTSLVFVAVAGVAIASGVATRRPLAVWCGVMGLAGAALAVESITRIVDQPFHYLLLWVAALPVLPLLGAAIGLQGLWAENMGWQPRASAFTAAVVFAFWVGGVVRAVDAKPAAALTDPDVANMWRAVQPIVGDGHQAVHLELVPGGRWPAAAGLGLELERHGHPVRVDPPWTLLFGAHRRATGGEPIDIMVAGRDADGWPAPTVGTLLGQSGPDVVFARRAGAACRIGWLPLGGPACPPLSPAIGPGVAPAP